MAHSRMMRNFIILQEDEKDQSVSKDKVLSGYVKIETRPDRCRISFYAQNIKADQNRCYMALICYKKDVKQIINIGALSIGREGKCDTGVEFPINDIAGLGLNAEKIIGAAIYKEIQGRTVYLMYGFINGHVPKEDWKKFSKLKCKDMEKEEEKKPKLEMKKPEAPKEKAKNIEVKVKDMCDAKDKKTEKECKKKDDFFDNEYIEDKKCKEKKKCDKDHDDDYDHHDHDDNHDHHDHDDNHDHHDHDDDHDHHDHDDDHDHHDHDDDHDHHDHDDDHDDKKCKKCSSMEQSVPTIEGVSDDIPLEMPLNITSIPADDGFMNAVRSDDDREKSTHIISEEMDEELLRTLKLKAIESELDEVKDKICSINKKNEEAILNELKKFKDVCLSQMQAVVQVVPKALAKDDKTKSDSKKRETNTFDEYEQKIDDVRAARLEKNNTYEIKGRIGEYFNNILSDVKTDNESIKDIQYCKWYNIPVNSIQQMCDKDNLSRQGIVYKLMVNNYPYIIKNHHFMFGIKGDHEGNAEYLVYAVPGTSNVKDQPYGGKSGFVTWVQAANKEKGMGYWLMFYDYKNEILVVPMKEN